MIITIRCYKQTIKHNRTYNIIIGIIYDNYSIYQTIIYTSNKNLKNVFILLFFIIFMFPHRLPSSFPKDDALS